MLLTGTYSWGNPRERGNQIVDAYGETFFAGAALGFSGFTDSEEIKSSDFLKGGSAVFVFSFQGKLIKQTHLTA